MFRTLVKKDLLHFIRDRKELLMLLFLPFLLITIMGFSLKNIMSGDDEAFSVTMAIVDEGNHGVEESQFLAKLQAQGLSHQQTEMLTDVSLPDLLTTQIEENEHLNFIQLTKVNDISLIETKDFDGVIHFPSGYRQATWEQLFFGEQEVPPANVYLNGQSSLKASIVEQIIDQLYRYWNLHIGFGEDGFTVGEENVLTSAPVGSWESIDQRESVSAFSYYTVGMSVMFALYMISFVANHARLEMVNHVFWRMMLANVNPWMYMMSKWASGTLLAFGQLVVVFSLSAIFYQTTFPDLVPFLVVTMLFAATVGSLAVLLTALSFRLKTGSLTDLFSGGMVALMAFVGGSFFDIEQISRTLSDIGGWMPNGVALRSYLHLLGGGEMSALYHTFYRLLLMIVIFFCAAWIIFPRRRGAQ
ncbi:ABC transporter permease [Shouchella lonarensis]|uniref:ABC-2 type transport system permease protein n=1 Tax=Shouchella lonarensis TaxID=1464122 RepID=A0A1G6HCP8_9BACI|nr:ABC transporter permease [Shouchella lonarensis]SDB91858.1 ABC-2 type transport system permease protein [Shouchella lonarensis]